MSGSKREAKYGFFDANGIAKNSRGLSEAKPPDNDRRFFFVRSRQGSQKSGRAFCDPCRDRKTGVFVVLFRGSSLRSTPGYCL
jgi:hypothetical protein